MKFIVFAALFVVNSIYCNDLKRSKDADTGDPLTWLLLNQIKKIDSTLEKLQERDDQLATHPATTRREMNSLKVQFSNLKRQVKVLECPYGQIKWRGSCYYFGVGLVTWNQARDKCISLGGHLVKIESAAENRMLLEEAKNIGWISTRHVWMGANDISREGIWRWVSDNSKIHVYTNWIPGEPSNHGGNEDCGSLLIHYDFRWNDGGCGNGGHYICEKEM